MQQLTQAMTEMRAEAVQKEQQQREERELEAAAASQAQAAFRREFVAFQGKVDISLADIESKARAGLEERARQLGDNLQGLVDNLQRQAVTQLEAATTEAAFARHAVRAVDARVDEQAERLAEHAAPPVESALYPVGRHRPICPPGAFWGSCRPHAPQGAA